jgi:hypothetical protein
MKTSTSQVLALTALASIMDSSAFTVSTNGPTIRTALNVANTESMFNVKTETKSFFMEEVPTRAPEEPIMEPVMNMESKSVVNTEPVMKAVEIETPKPATAPAPAAAVKKAAPKKPRKTPPGHKEGVFSPLVYTAKAVAGEQNINKLRGKFIGMHSKTITDFVATHETEFGSTVSQFIFNAMDKNKDGTIDEEELALAFESIGFTWLDEKKVSGIMKRADKDDNGILDYEEFKAELPKILKANLIKMAKNNGAEMGLLV